MTLRRYTYFTSSSIFSLLALAVAVLVMPLSSRAFAPDFYAPSSRLASGRWVKISVTDDGIHSLSPSALKQMGFSDPSQVKIFGRGGRPIDVVFNADRHYDDLPQIPLIRRADGSILFYAEGVKYLSSANTPLNNPYSSAGYYFLTDSQTDLPDLLIESASYQADNSTPVESVYFTLVHEKELIPAAITGSTCIGESFIRDKKQSFDFSLPGLSPEGTYNVRCTVNFLAGAVSTSTLSITVNDQSLSDASPLSFAPISGSHTYYSVGSRSFDIPLQGNSLKLGLSYESAYTPKLAGLDYITLTYPRPLSLSADESLLFTSYSTRFRFSGAQSGFTVLDVTHAAKPVSIPVEVSGSSAVATASGSHNKTLIAFNPDAKFPAPKYCGAVANQDIHSLPAPDMVIFAPAEFIPQANRLADRRRLGPDALTVHVIDQQQVFNEFSSGAPDAMAFRKCLKMFYDRSVSTDRPLRYALFFGRGTYDNRQISSEVKNLTYPKMPIYESYPSDTDSDSFTTDDYFAFLEDGSGNSPAADYYSIAVGRLPATSSSDAKSAVDKIITYEEKMEATNWRNRMLLVADDEDGGVHLNQTERMWREAQTSPRGANTLYDKIYQDYYERDGTITKAAPVLKRALAEGTTYFSYIGHANPTMLSHETLLSYSDINSLHLSRYPIMYAATCEFLRWDDTTISGAEIMWKLSTGGAIAIISANRPVYISDNGPLSASFARHCHDIHPDGRPFTLGEIYQMAKNDFRKLIGTGTEVGAVQPNSNKLRFVLLGDPSMYPVTARNQVVIDAINGVDPADESKQIVIEANQNVVISGHIASYDGTPLSGFNGTVNTTLYDADRSLITLGHGSTGVKQSFDQHGDRLFEGNYQVRDGIFHIKIPMANEIANNFRNASLNLFAQSVDGATASGLERRFYVSGFDDNAAADTIPPVIKSFYLNHRSFTDGGIVNPSPIAIAEITDNRVINIGTAGVGHQISLKLDGGTSFTDVAQYYTPYTDGTPGGVIAYPLSSLPEGPHELRLRVWDGSANSATATLYFQVNDSAEPTIYDIYTDANPASVEANFYLSYDRPASDVDVTLNIYNLLGHRVWTTTKSGRADSVLGFPITWDLTDNNGRRVPRGIYIYQAAVTADGATSKTLSRKIAVTAQ